MVVRTLLVLALSSSAAFAGESDDVIAGGFERLTVEKTFELNDKLAPKYARRVAWLDGRTYLAHDELAGSEDGEDGDGAEETQKQLVAVDVATGEKRAHYDVDRMVRALGALTGVTEKEARSWSRRSRYRFSADHRAVLLNEKNDLFFYRFGDERALRLTGDPTEEVGETISPDGRMVAYISDYDLHVIGTDGTAARALTSAGHENLLFGRLDWVYQEEVYGRGNFEAYWWSPDSSRLAFLALDESPVPEYTIVDDRETRPNVEVWRYPKAGDPNPTVKLGVVDVGGGEPRWIDLSRYAGHEFLIVRVGWTPDGEEVIAQVQDRIQTWIDVVSCNPSTGTSKVLFRDRTEVWIEPSDAPFWTGDGKRFVWLSERDGYRHLYLYDRDGTLERRLTEGPWEVDAVHGIDSKAKVVYFTGDRDDVKGAHLYRVAVDGTRLERISEEPGSHGVSVSPDWTFYLDDFSSLNDPGRASAHRTDGTLVRVLAEGSDEVLAPYGLTRPEFVKVETRDGFEMEAMIIKPPGYDPGRRYPVVSHTYGGPHAPTVNDRFANRFMLWHQMLAQQDFVIWVCDNRSASGKGLESVKGIYKNLGAGELRDIEDGLKWLIDRGIADPDRIGLWGWSYGGYMTAYALTHSEMFKVGIAGAPVTDWRLYDSIYTERYMDRPQANPEGYKSSSVLEAAKNLSGRLLVIHGVIDENVHVQNTLQLVLALQDAGKSFDLMLYPGNRHGVRRTQQRNHMYQMMADYFVEHL